MGKARKRLTEKDIRAYKKVLQGQKQVDIAKEEGVSSTMINKRVAKAEAVMGPEFIEAARNELCGAVHLAIKGLYRHLNRPLPNPVVLNKCLDGTGVYVNEQLQNVNLITMSDDELIDDTAKLLAKANAGRAK